MKFEEYHMKLLQILSHQKCKCAITITQPGEENTQIKITRAGEEDQRPHKATQEIHTHGAIGHQQKIDQGN